MPRFFNDEESKKYFKQIVEAVAFMHNNGVIHRDLKLENIFLCNGKPKVGDFDVALRLGKDEQVLPGSILAGTPGYMSPEMWENAGYGFAADVYALGVIMYALRDGIIYDEEFPRDFNKRRPIADYLSKDAKDLLTKLLDLNPVNRPSSDEILRHPWLANVIEIRK